MGRKFAGQLRCVDRVRHLEFSCGFSLETCRLYIPHLFFKTRLDQMEILPQQIEPAIVYRALHAHVRVQNNLSDASALNVKPNPNVARFRAHHTEAVRLSLPPAFFDDIFLILVAHDPVHSATRSAHPTAHSALVFLPVKRSTCNELLCVGRITQPSG